MRDRVLTRGYDGILLGGVSLFYKPVFESVGLVSIVHATATLRVPIRLKSIGFSTSAYAIVVVMKKS